MTGKNWPTDCGDETPQGICGAIRYCDKHGGTVRVPDATTDTMTDDGKRLCRVCGEPIAPTGKRGRPAVKCETCRNA